MPEIPIVDALFSALISQDKAALDDIESQHAAECVNIRAVFCTDAPGAIDLDLGLGVSSSEYVIPFFEGPRAFLMSANTSIQARIGGGCSNALIDYSLSFDSNFAEKLRAVVNGENIQQVDRDRVNDVFTLKARNRNVQFDLTPFLIENTRLTRDNPSNERPLNTLIAFRMLDYLDWDAFERNPNCLVFNTPYEELKASLRADAEQFLSELQTSQHVLHQEAKSVGTQALLLRFARLWHGSKREKQHILSELIRFSIHKLGSLPITELRLIWSGMTSETGSPFFGPITGKSKDLFQKIRGMAWDITLLRGLEQIATSKQVGGFFIPYFVSIDQRWRHLLRLNPVRLMLIDDVNRRVLFARTNEMEFQGILNECLQADLKSEMTPEKIEARRRSMQGIQLNIMEQLVAEEEDGWLASVQ